MSHQLDITEGSPPPAAPTRWEFHVMGQPVPWERTGGFGKRRYTPPKTKAYQDEVATIAAFRRPAGWPFRSKDVEFVMRLQLYHKDLRRRDNDNCAKSVKDALNGIAYRDDFQVSRLEVERFLDRENPRVEVILEIRNQ